jgi:hypothetical protein
MSAGRHHDVLDVVSEMTEHENQQAAVRHVCIACGIRTNAVGTAIYLSGGRGVVHPFEATGFCGEEIAELQAVLGEGPASEAIRRNRPVLVPDLADSASAARWPLFAPAAVAAGVEAVFAFPLTLGALSLGALEIHRDTSGSLAPDEIAGVVQLADMAMTLLLDQSVRVADRSMADEHGGEPVRRWNVLHEAIGVVATQLNIGDGEAFVRLRVQSGLTGRHLSQVANDVVERGVMFTINDR